MENKKLSEKELYELIIKELGINIDVNDYKGVLEWEGEYTIIFKKKLSYNEN